MVSGLKNMNARSFIDYGTGKTIPCVDYGTSGGSRYPINQFGNQIEIDLPTDKNIRHMILEFNSEGVSISSLIVINLEINGVETILEGHFDMLQKNNHYLFGVNQTTFSTFVFIPLENDPITHKGMIKTHSLSSFKLRIINEDDGTSPELLRIGFIELKDMEE